MGKNLIFVKIKIDRNEEDKSTYFINEAGEPQGKLNEEIRDMLAMTVVATNRPPIFSYKKDPEIKGLIDEVKKDKTYDRIVINEEIEEYK